MRTRLGRAGLYYEPKFDFGAFDETGYRVKQADNTSTTRSSRASGPRLARRRSGCEPWRVQRAAATKVAHVTADVERPTEAGDAEIALDLDGDFDSARPPTDAVLVPDVLASERPEEGVRKIAAILARRTTLREHGQHPRSRHAPQLFRPVFIHGASRASSISHTRGCSRSIVQEA